MGLKNILEPFLRKDSTGTHDAGNTATAVADRPVKAKYHGISPKEAKAIMDSGDPVTVLDVREPSEYRSGHIQNAVLLPSGVVPVKAADVLPDKDAKILVYCLSGARSSTAARQLVKLGYTNVYDFGGIVGWQYGVVKN